MMQIHLIRHGKTAANEQKLYCGSTNLPLSDDGINELAQLRRQGVYPKNIDLYFTSGLLRTEQTLDLLYGKAHREVLVQFAEYNFGQFEMKSYEELKTHNVYQNWITDKTGLAACPGGECKQGFGRRILEGLKILEKKAQPNKAIAAICHGGVITCLMEHLFPGEKHFYEWQPVPGRGYTLIYTRNGLQAYKNI